MKNTFESIEIHRKRFTTIRILMKYPKILKIKFTKNLEHVIKKLAKKKLLVSQEFFGTSLNLRDAYGIQLSITKKPLIATLANLNVFHGKIVIDYDSMGDIFNNVYLNYTIHGEKVHKEIDEFIDYFKIIAKISRKDTKNSETTTYELDMFPNLKYIIYQEIFNKREDKTTYKIVIEFA